MTRRGARWSRVTVAETFTRRCDGHLKGDPRATYENQLLSRTSPLDQRQCPFAGQLRQAVTNPRMSALTIASTTTPNHTAREHQGGVPHTSGRHLGTPP